MIGGFGLERLTADPAKELSLVVAGACQTALANGNAGISRQRLAAQAALAREENREKRIGKAAECGRWNRFSNRTERVTREDCPPVTYLISLIVSLSADELFSSSSSS